VATGDEAETFREILGDHGPTEFVGREQNTTTTTVIGVVSAGTDDEGTDLVSIFLKHTPFYAEAGGQIGDTGEIRTDGGRAEVIDTVYALPGLHRHVARIAEGTIDLGAEAVATIDVERRNNIRRHHTGTHILHWALREVLGDHVKQQGSVVEPDRLRFDFSHFEAVTPTEIAAIEDLANDEILTDAEARHYETTMDDARERGAIAFFGDKYGDVVRVLEAGPHSIELCGGTHVRSTGQIGTFRFSGQTGVAAGVRRVVTPCRLAPARPRRWLMCRHGLAGRERSGGERRPQDRQPGDRG
jgi:alanyl-tRNA synthetase